MWKSVLLVLLIGCRKEDIALLDGEVAEVGDGQGVFVDVERPDITTFALLSEIQVGDLVISEVMHSPTQSTFDSYGEWIELYNASAVSIDLQNLVISSTSTGDTSVTFTNSLVVAPGEYVLLATKSTGNGGLTGIDGYYSFNSVRHQVTDDLTIGYNATTFDSVSWTIADDNVVVVGASITLDGDDLDATLNDSAYRWYAGYQSYGDGDFGTPGSANTALYMGDELATGELIITEIMLDPVLTVDWKGEWFEVYNTTSVMVQVGGLSVTSSNNVGFSVTENFSIQPGHYAVFGNRPSSVDNGGYTPDVYFVNSTLTFGAPDDLTLSSGLGVIDTVAYTDGAPYAGYSMNLSTIAFDSTKNDNMSLWCPATSTYGVGDYGTPGTANVDCPSIDFDGDGVTLEEGDCDDTDPLVGLPTDDEVCDGVDNDCDGLIDEADDSLVYSTDNIWYLDFDGDGYGVESTLSVYACAEPVGTYPYVVTPYVQNNDDCDDFDSTLNLDDTDGDGVSTCDGDCDDTDATLEMLDTDGDGVSTCDGDCDDTDITIYPEAVDIANDGIDQDCDGTDSVCTDCDLNLDIGGGFTLNFVTISAGTFTMGSPSGEVGRATTETQHTVTLTNDFMVMTTEVTQGMFYQLMGYQSYEGYSQISSPYGYGDDYPAYYVSWHMAAIYANAVTQYHNTLYGTALEDCYLCSGTDVSATCSQNVNPYTCTGYRLLTEAEWEYTARAGDGSAFWTPAGNGELPSGFTSTTSGLSNGFDLQSYAWYHANNTGTSQPVAQLLPNDYGVYDMSGNVLEWVHDYYGAYATGSATDPVTMLGTYRVLRGGYWDHTPSMLRSAARSNNTPTNRSLGAGFRLAYIP